jgi:hypothetical protein
VVLICHLHGIADERSSFNSPAIALIVPCTSSCLGPVSNEGARMLMVSTVMCPTWLLGA